ncbi:MULTISPECIES: cytochrome ubiquinol oxidase subunit I [unclassified Nocardioides]|uniref:cytochrome ubiquinol oxidase subunit I n=1 Tax=unclassified Nocardioides TaxID=2615069 RepID=UPI00070330AB|nr:MULTISPECIES: cytochrome ubiquinol oxidase subunit I [unclassified Nocardioides]KRC50300.1 cytochrome BD ubiquinol oxidase subunit I [Nocardioides sp. Root79]KRC75768.1 cytochrome BD ubiquinol oxidase subunit I [Nocardioides sp. Root240]
MDPTDIARWQFAITTVYHFLFVPITIGLSAIIAGYEITWLRTRDERWLRLTKFFGKLFLINFAIGVVTGIVQEFQFGMNWSDYSRFVGDVFGAPLAIEGLLAFFLESTFLGLWIFGWDRLSPRLHAACIVLVHIGTLFSAYFILAANSWMQHPVGYSFNPDTGRAEMNDFAAVLFNKVQLVTFPHVVLSAYMTGAAFVVGIALWHLRRATTDADRALHRPAVRTGAWIVLVAALGVIVSGDVQGKIMTEVQPMKMAAAEGLYETEQPADFSVFQLGTLDGEHETFSVKVPGLLSFLATGTPGGEVEGINDLREQYRETYGADPGAAYYSPGDYTPVIPLTYWSFRLMIGLGMAGVAVAAWVLWATRGSRTPQGRPVLAAAIALPFLPLLANSFGWIFTEMGRQPWAVFGLMTTEHSVSPGLTTTEAWISLITLTAVYGVLAVVEVRLMLTWIRRGVEELPPDLPADTGEDRPLAFAY